MDDPGGRERVGGDGPGEPSVSPDPGLDGAGGSIPGGDSKGLAPSEAFGALASEVRVTVLVELLAAERAGREPLSFSALQAATEVDTSAGFAYHLRQLSGHFVREKGEGYVLTPAGRRAARAIVDGTFTGDAGRAS